MTNPNSGRLPERLLIDPVTIEVLTDGVPSHITLSSTGVHYSLGLRTYPTQILGRESLDFAHALMEQADQPFLGSHLELGGYVATEQRSVSERYKYLTDFVLRQHPLSSHFIKFGRGSATWYGFLSDNRNPGRLIQAGRDLVRSESTERVTKRLKPFDELEKYYAGDTDSRFGKKQIVGAGAALLIVAGGAVTYVYRSRNSEPK